MKAQRANRVLFLTFEGVGSTIFQSQVAAHALEMKRRGIDVAIWATETVPSLHAISERNACRAREQAQIDLRLFRGVPWFLPGSTRLNAILLYWRLLRAGDTVDVVHARADYAAAVYSLVPRRCRVPFVWDCRGDWEPEIAQALSGMPSLPKALKDLLLRSVRHAAVRAGGLCAAANFVSASLQARKASLLRGQPTFVTPCAVPEHMFFFDPELRKATRNRLDLRESDVVLIYSGALTRYQGFSAYPRLVNQLAASSSAQIKLLVVTPDTVAATKVLASELRQDQFIVRSAEFAEVNSLLNAADCGLLLREKSPVNDVASPTKFGEYCLAGLPVVVDGNVEQASKVGLALGNGVDVQELASNQQYLPLPDSRRGEISRQAIAIYGRAAQAETYLRMYSAAVSRP